jgi:glycosyltransferase involved in cell wall biosynthesis
MWCSLFARMRGLKIPILAHSFNFTELPPPLKRPMFAWTLQRIDRFLVFSNVERELYSKAFGLPVDRFDFVHWGVRRPEVENPDKPFVPGDYVCAIGGNARDYRTLIEAARRVPEVPFVLVVRPANLQGLDIPANVKVYTNLPFGRTMNVLAYSRFMLLPLVTSEVPCGHVTLVASMYLGKAYVITDSAGVRDYVHNGENALTVTVNSVDDLMAATRRLWADPALCRRLGENGLRFARSECTEERIEEHFRGWLKARNIVRP